MKPARGYTLVEVLVASVIGLLITGVVGALLVLGFRTWHHSDNRSQAQEQTLLVLSLVTQQVRHAYPNSLNVINQSVSPHYDALTWLSDSNDAAETVLDPASGDVLWQSRGSLYVDLASQQVMWQRVVLVPPVTDVDPTQMVVTTLSPLPTDHVVARHVTSLSMSLQNSILVVSVQTVIGGLTCQQETSVTTVMPWEDYTVESPTP